MNVLNLGELQLGIELLKRQVEERDKPYLDWLVCDVVVSLPAFKGEIRWSVMPSELERLAADLSKMHDESPAAGEVTFRPTESNVLISFSLKPTGQVLGKFAFCPDVGEETVLKGSFKIDQSYLPEIVSGIQVLLKSSVDKIEYI